MVIKGIGKLLGNSVRAVGAVAIAGTLFAAAPNSADAAVFTFTLNDHPDGNQAPPTYGLRLDGLFGDTSKEYTFTFDPANDPNPGNPPEIGVTMIYDDVSNVATITGTVYGGEDIGNGYGTNKGFASLVYQYTDVIKDPAYDGTNLGLLVTDQTKGSGTLTLLASNSSWANPYSSDVFELAAKSNGSFAFKHNNTEDHRLVGHGLSGPTTFVGWGWQMFQNQDPNAPQNIDNMTYIGSGDFLFTATLDNCQGCVQIAEPASTAPLALGLAVLALAWHRRRAKGTRKAA